MKKLLIKELVVEKELENIPYIRENFRRIEEGIADGTLGGGGTGTPGPAGPPGPPGPPGDPASYTDEEAQDAVGNILVDSATIDFQYDDGTPAITASVKDNSIGDIKLIAGINANKISTGIVSNTEFDYLDGLTGNIQDQLDEPVEAPDVLYTPSDPSDWDVVPDDVAEALDSLADEVANIVFPVYPENFSYREVLSGVTVEIPSEQQMILVGEPLLVDGVLNIEGSVVLDEFEETLTYDEALNFSFKNIVANQSLTIPENQQMIVEDELVVEGELIVEGEISLLYSINEDDYPLYEIPSGVVVNVREYREYFLSDGLILEGVINVEGKLALGA